MTPAARQPPGLGEVRARLHRDPWWSAYALGDLDPRRQRHCAWYVRDDSVALLYREFDAPVLWADGDPGVLDDLPDLRDCYLQVPEAFLAAVERRFTVDGIRPVYRMGLDPADLQPAPGTSDVEPLDESHEHEIRELYADGEATHEAPDFFWRSQLGDGTFVGVRHEGRLVAAGGTHLYSAEESVGAIGNVFTHRAHRGRGHASAITTAVARRLIERGTDTVVLNVRCENLPAIRIYERLGFRRHVRFREGRARGR